MIKVKCFGMITELVGIDEFEVENLKHLDDFKDAILTKYPKLGKAKYSIAVDRKLENSNIQLPQNCEIALLPPFSGG